MLPEEEEHPERFNRHGYPLDRTGMDAWSLTLKREREKKMKVELAKNRPPLREHEVVVEAHEIPLGTLTKQSTVGKIAHLAADHGWEVTVYSSSYRTADLWRKDEVVEGRIEEHRWCHGIAPDRKHYFSVSKIALILDGWHVDSLEEVKIHITELGTEA